MVEKVVEIVNETGLHARPASQFVDLVSKFESEIIVQSDGRTTNAKSILGVLGLGVSKGSKIRIVVEGSDEQQVIEKIIAFFNTLED